MKLSKRDIQLLYVLGGIILLFISYQFVFKALSSKAEAVSYENTSLDLKITELKALEAQKDFFEEETKKMNAYNEVTLASFPAGFRSEDGILYSAELEDKTTIEISSVSLGSDELVHSLGQAEGEGNETPQGNVVLHKSSIGLNYKASYTSLKKALNYINKDAHRRTVESLSASYDNSTGILQGTINMNAYSLTGTDKAYEPPIVNNIRTGTNNIFRTLEIHE